MNLLLFIFLTIVASCTFFPAQAQERKEIKIVQDLFRLRNEHKADSAELYYADTVLTYMKYLKNIPRRIITEYDKSFWRTHPQNKFEIIDPVQLTKAAGVITTTIIGKEYLDGKTFQYEKIEIKFDKDGRIFSFRGFKLNTRK